MARKPAEPKPPTETFAISPPNMQELQITIIGMAPLMICRFSAKAMATMMEKQSAGILPSHARDLDRSGGSSSFPIRIGLQR